MDRRSILTIGVAAGMGFVPRAAMAQEKSLKEQVLGTWTLVSWVQTLGDGSKRYRFGDNPKGIHMFSPNGQFTLIQMRSDLPKISSGDPLKPTPEEAEAIVRGVIAYYGTYTVDEASRTLIFKIAATTLVNQLGLEQKRTIEAIGPDEMRYVNSNAVGNLGRIEAVWKRG